MPELQHGVQHVPLPDISQAKATAIYKSLQKLVQGHIPTFNTPDDRTGDTYFERLGIKFVGPASGRPHEEVLEHYFLTVLLLLWEWVVHPIVKAIPLTVSVTRI